jgi:ornithine decarboxylase
MTHSLSFAALERNTCLRGLDSDPIREIFAGKSVETPQMLISSSEIARNYDALRQALPRAAIHYAVKSNNHPAILRQVINRGGNFDVCSVGEINEILKLDLDPASLIHSHPIKSRQEFDGAVDQGVEIFVVDNDEEIRKLSRYTDKKLKILVRFRINTNATAVVDLQYKFGCTPREVLPLAEQIRQAGHKYHGLCFHIGSQCIYPENYIRAIETAHDLIYQLQLGSLNTSMLDIGGGFPVEYVEPVPTIDDFCRPINKALEELIRPGIKVVCEPGRFISASPVTLVCSVIGKAVRNGKVWYYLNDGLYSTFSGMVFDQCQYPVVTAKDGPLRLSVLAGPTCDSFDTMYDGLMVPEHEVGDLFVFPLTGAYCAVSGSNFNSLRRPHCDVVR